MPNTFLFVDWLTMESLRILLNKLVIASMFNTDYEKEYEREFAVGETVRIKLPQRYLIRDGLGYTPGAITRLATTVTLNQVFGIDFEWDSVEKALKMERGEAAISKEYIEPAMAQIAQEIDSRAALWALQNTNNVAGALGTNPTALSTYYTARQRMIENACPPGPRSMILSPGMQGSIVTALTTLYNPNKEISKQYLEGSMGHAIGFDWFESMSLYASTAGVWQTPSSVTVSGAGQTGSSLLVNCTSGDTFNQGDVFNMASVYNVNPSTRRTTGTLKQFVITQAVTASGATATIQISPAITGPGSQYQNVDSLPADTALLTLYPGTTTPSTGPKTGINGLALHRDAFAIVGAKLETPKAVEMASQTRDPETGLAVRFVRMFDPIQSKMINRFDVLLGFGNLYPDQCSVRLLSST